MLAQFQRALIHIDREHLRGSHAVVNIVDGLVVPPLLHTHHVCQYHRAHGHDSRNAKTAQRPGKDEEPPRWRERTEGDAHREEGRRGHVGHLPAQMVRQACVQGLARQRRDEEGVDGPCREVSLAEGGGHGDVAGCR